MKPPARNFDFPDPSGASQWQQQQQQQQQPYPQLCNSDPQPSSQVPRTFNEEVGVHSQDLGAYPVGEVSYHGLSPTAGSAFDGRNETQQAGRWQTIHIQQNNIAGPSHIPPNQQRQQQQQQLTRLDRDRERADFKPENQLSRLSSRPGGPNSRPQPHQGYGSSSSDQEPQQRGQLVGSRARELQPRQYYSNEHVASAGFPYQNTSLYPPDPPPLQQYGSSLLPFHIDNNSSPNSDPQKYHSGGYAEFSGIKPALREYQAPQRSTAGPSRFNTAQHQVGSDGSHGFIPPQRDFHGYAQSTHLIDPALQATDNPQHQQTYAEHSSNNKDGNTDRNQPGRDDLHNAPEAQYPSNDGYVPYFNQDLQVQPGNMPQANFADMDNVTLAPMYGCALPSQSQQYSTGQSSSRQSVTEKGKGAGQQTQAQQL
ncbi:hypothetical protein MBM_06868 [Drepanopeziza brunnea f. sp. 'multigermtubi' MB_m1]|uniref:Uncharacterized protein n=2 Tax=Drepanopeziza brunnea f. sp. 'multigermtubi' TaxID=698441 RepID=K1WRU1_MARBU|nr:uncharacterized protein MBM_06868 [Drepanopeziza brunnea f. sp. 'multigermtubi' MB_m1]EKD15107.1 hypothetical protein MBM_06868 [Drepanopeziza brunnea f. sp. 'multigermtubi' MB_m1]